MRSAVLLIVFNRPGTTATVMDAIRRARPPKLYIAADGARAERDGEADRVAQVRAIATAVDWPCAVETLFRDTNLGCRRAVSGALDWFFAAESEGIVLEDDVLPSASFFPFCDQLLERYRDDPSVMMIAGYNPIASHYRPASSYFFTPYVSIWGWASWARAWRGYDVDMASWRAPDAQRRLCAALGDRSRAVRHWTTTFDQTAAGAIDTWDYQLVWHAWHASRVSIMPARNLCDNLGFGPDATHTTWDRPAGMLSAGAEDIAFPLHHPSSHKTDARVDRLIERHAHQISIGSQIRRRLLRGPFGALLRRIRKAARRFPLA